MGPGLDINDKICYDTKSVKTDNSNFPKGVTMTRDEHLQRCKDNALKYVEKGALTQAWVSMVSDLNKHDETRGHSAINLGMMLFVTNNLNTKDEMKKFIEGFN